jgi:hypothetical protein
MRTWGDIRDCDEKTRIDLYQFKGRDVWTACPTVGSNSWKSRDYPTLHEALQGGERWILEMAEYGFNCDGTAPQLRTLDAPPYSPGPDSDCYDEDDPEYLEGSEPVDLSYGEWLDPNY